MKIPFVGPTYQARSINADCQRAINCYLEMDNASPRAPVALYGTPGTILRATLGTAPVRGCIRQNNYGWWVAGSSVYRVDSSYAATLLGVMSTSSGEIGIASNGVQILIVDGVSGWIVEVATSVLSEIIDPDFPSGVRRATYQDGFFIVSGDNSGRFYINETPNNGNSWNGLDFASAEGSPDNSIGVISDHRELWVFGEDSAEIWVNTGNADFPFERSGNVFIEHGCAAAGTIAKADNSVFWLGADELGEAIVWRADGYTPVRVSTHGVEAVLQTYATVSDAFAFTYQQEGHTFYVLTFPTADATWVYDAATQQWHERSWFNQANSSNHRWRPSCHMFLNGEHLVGDFETGAIYALDLDTYTDNAGPIIRRRVTASFESMQKRMFFRSMQVDMETGVGISVGQGSSPLVMLRWSNDGGHTWSNEKTATVGRIGEYNARAMFNRLGSGRNRVWELSMSDPVKFAVFGAFAEVEQGVS